MKKKFLSLLILGLVVSFAAQAKVIRVSEPSQVKDVLVLEAGDTVILAEGTWNNLDIRIKSVNGTAVKPVVFMGETAGKTILTGQSYLKMSGPYVIAENLWFQDPQSIMSTPLEDEGDSVIAFRSDDGEYATNGVVRNCMMTGFNLPLTLKEHKWVSLYGTDNTVEHCSFEDKSWLGATVVVWPDTTLAREPHHTIRNNYFTRPRSILTENGGSMNCQESIRVGSSHVSLSPAYCVVENNVFERCNGEAEIISIKTCSNIVRNNVFLESVGSITLRHGNGSLVENNYFDGRNVKGTGGIRLVGENQIVRNNYMQDMSGEGGTAAIAVVMGITNAVLNSYSQVVNAVIENNVIIDCNQGMAVNLGTRALQEQPFANSRVQNNVFISKNQAALIYNRPAPKDVIWKDNVFEGGTFEGCTLSSLGATAEAKVKRKPAPIFPNGASWESK
ncbi:MAG: polysaccharide lyase 6 family protein [Rikenellaceae bacterium]